MAAIADLTMTFLETALLTNPTAQFFNWTLTDFPYPLYPNGVPRASVVAAFAALTGGAPVSPTALSFTTLGSDNFSRANENPLTHGGKWAQPYGNLSSPLSTQPIQLLSNQAVATTLRESAAIYKGAALPSDQFAQIVLGTLEGSTWMGRLYLRASNDVAEPGSVIVEGGYCFQFSDSFLQVGPGNGVDGGVQPSPIVDASFQSGDVLVAIAVGSTALFYQNGKLLLNWQTGSNVAGSAGYAGFSLNPLEGALTSLTCADFICGSVSGGFNNSIYGLNTGAGARYPFVPAAQIQTVSS